MSVCFFLVLWSKMCQKWHTWWVINNIPILYVYISFISKTIHSFWEYYISDFRYWWHSSIKLRTLNVLSSTLIYTVEFSDWNISQIFWPPIVDSNQLKMSTWSQTLKISKFNGHNWFVLSNDKKTSKLIIMIITDIWRRHVLRCINF